MSEESFASIEGHRLTALRLLVGNVGPWTAECDLEGDATLPQHVTIKLGDVLLRGVVVAPQAGTFGLQRRCRVVGGAGGWSRELTAKNYHNDAGIKARLVAEDAAREVGESLGSFVPAAERIGNDYVRQAGQAARALEDVLGGSAWWVDFGGITHAGPRPSAPVDKSAYEVLAFDPRTRIATLAVDSAAAVTIGSVLAERLDGPQTVRELELHIDGAALRVTAWCGGSEGEHGRLAGLVQALVRRVTDRPLLGKYRYRVVSMAADGRVELQAVRKGAGLPDVNPVSMWPGVAGAHAELAPGAQVLVEFVEGDRTLPIITHFAGKGGEGFVPVSLSFCGSTQAAARQGDLVQSGGVGTTVTFAGVGAPPNNAVAVGVPYLISFSADPLAVGPLQAALYGAISTGSPKVRT